MNKNFFAFAVLGLLLSGCAHQTPVDRVSPQVSVEGGRVVAPPVLILSKGQSTFTINWQLPADSKFTFPDNGIVIEGLVVFPTETVLDVKGEPPNLSTLRIDRGRRSNFECARKSGQQFACSTKELADGIYKYTVRVQGPDGTLRQDPPIIIMK